MSTRKPKARHEATQTQRIRLSTRAKLVRLAQADNRSTVSELDFLIQAEIDRRDAARRSDAVA